MPCQERCEDAEMRLSTCAETWTFGVITDLATQGARNTVYLVMENPTKKEWKVGRENPTYTAKFSMEPEDHGFQKDLPFPGTYFQVPCSISGV